MFSNLPHSVFQILELIELPELDVEFRMLSAYLLKHFPDRHTDVLEHAKSKVAHWAFVITDDMDVVSAPVVPKAALIKYLSLEDPFEVACGTGPENALIGFVKQSVRNVGKIDVAVLTPTGELMLKKHRLQQREDRTNPLGQRELQGAAAAMLVAGSMPQSTQQKRRGRPKKQERDKEELVISALAKHHGYDAGSIDNYSPATVKELAEISRVSKSTVSRFFKSRCRGYKGYVASCHGGRMKNAIGELLAKWQGEERAEHIEHVEEWHGK